MRDLDAFLDTVRQPMTAMTVIPKTFKCADSSRSWDEELVVAAALDLPAVKAVLEAIDAVDWAALEHAYRAATDTPAHLVAVAVGDRRCQELAWSELWGTIHHQGTVYSATLPAVAIIAALARWKDYPNRAMAIVYLRDIAVGDGSHAAEVRLAVHDEAPRLLSDQQQEPQEVQRALVWLLTAFGDHAAANEELVARLLPEEHRPMWTEMLASGPEYWPDGDAEYDAFCELEAWATNSPTSVSPAAADIAAPTSRDRVDRVATP